jgi:hypothetical protein
MLDELGVNTSAHLQRALTPVKTFAEEAKWWEEHVLLNHKPSSRKLQSLYSEETFDSFVWTNVDR